MERIVVVIGPRERKSFAGKNLEAIDHSESGTNAVKLIIKERGEKDEIAVFRHWRYWYQTKEEKEDSNDIMGHYKADYDVLIPITRKFLDEHPDLIKSVNFVDLYRYNLEEDGYSPDKDAEEKIIEEKTKN